MKSKHHIIAYIVLLPSISLILIFKIYPILLSLINSFYQTNYLTGLPKFIGLKNYINLFEDLNFWKYFWVTIKLNILITPIQIAIAFFMSLLVNQQYRFARLFRMLFFIPLGVSLAISVIYLSLFFKPGTGGLINQILLSFGLSPQEFYLSESQAIWVIIFIASWKGCSFWMLFFLAGLQDIDSSILEASYIDGAKLSTRIFKIIIPLMKRPILFVSATDTSINFVLFVPIFMLTKGGPSDSTHVLMYESYKNLLAGNYGQASAITFILLLLLALILILQFLLLKPEKD